MLSNAIARAILKGDGRVIVSMPPRHGKSRLVSRWTPLWFLDRYPDRHVMLLSYSHSFASKWGRFVRNTALEYESRLRFEVDRKVARADLWETTAGGGMLSSGVGGPITGRDCDLMLIDDPIKNAEEARSQVQRDNLWDWWETTAGSRLEPGATAILCMTRWHEDDLAGRFIREGGWTEVRLPALAECNDWRDDPLHRQRDEALWPDRYDAERLMGIRKKRSPRVWASIYQQRPAPEEGGIFKREWFQSYSREGDVLNLNGRRLNLWSLHRFLTVDLALTEKQQSDHTAIGAWAWVEDGTLILLDVYHDQIDAPKILPAIKRMGKRWRASVFWIESVAFQKAIVQIGRRIMGLPCRELHPDTDKVSRALAATCRWEDGLVWLPESAHWLERYTTELLTFPEAATGDDQVDMTSYAGHVANEHLTRAELPTPSTMGVAADRYDPAVTLDIPPM